MLLNVEAFDKILLHIVSVFFNNSNSMIRFTLHYFMLQLRFMSYVLINQNSGVKGVFRGFSIDFQFI